MDENPTQQTDAPVQAPVQAPPEPKDEPAPSQDQVVAPAEEQPVSEGKEEAQAPTVPAEPETPPEDEEDDYQYQPVAPVPPIDFSQLPADENGLIDPNALASVFNQRISMAEQNATANAQRIYAEQKQEENLWAKAYEKYPDLKNDKELHNLVHQARIGEATDILSRSNDPNNVKLPTPAQVADKLFKRIGSAKSEGMQQANTNTQVQKSAVLETAGRKSDDGADDLAQAKANLSNPNPEVRKQAANRLLRNKLGWD